MTSRTAEYREQNKNNITKLLLAAKQHGFFPVYKGVAVIAKKCPHGCGVSSIMLKSIKTQKTIHKCFRCGK